MAKLKVAVIGTGIMGKSHLRVYSEMEEVELVGLCDADPETGASMSTQYGVPHFASPEELLEEVTPDAVSVCVPTKHHVKAALPFLSKGIHVLVEKPIAPSEEEAQKLIAHAASGNAKLMVGHIERFNPVVRELKRRIEAKELGPLYKIHTVRFSPFPKRILDVGVTIDLAVHDIDVLRHLAGSDIVRVFAETNRRIHSDHEDLLVGTLRFDDGVLGVVNANWLTPRKVRELTITGERGMFCADYLQQTLTFYENDFKENGKGYEQGYRTVIEGKQHAIPIEREEPLKNELEAFVNAIQSGEAMPVSGEDGLEVLRLAHAFLRSAQSHQAVEP